MAVFWLFVTSLHSGFLGILIALARTPWYPAHRARRARGLGLTPLEDQQLAGLIMRVPAGVVYAGAAPHRHGALDRIVRAGSREDVMFRTRPERLLAPPASPLA